MESNARTQSIAWVGMSFAILVGPVHASEHVCQPVQRNRAVERVTLQASSSGQAFLQVEVSAAISGERVPNLDTVLVVNVNGRTVSTMPVNFALPASAGACGFGGEDNLQCVGSCGTSGLFSCKGLVISGGMYCGCSILKNAEAGPYSVRPGDRLSIAVIPARGAADELYRHDDRQELVVVRGSVDARVPVDYLSDRFTVRIAFANPYDASQIEIDTVRLNETVVARSVEALRNGLAVTFSQSAVAASGADRSSMTVTGRYRDGTRFWGLVEAR